MNSLGEAFKGKTVSAQATLMTSAKNKVTTLFPGTVATTFVPPRLSFDSNTYTAMQQVGLNVLASHSSTKGFYFLLTR